MTTQFTDNFAGSGALDSTIWSPTPAALQTPAGDTDLTQSGGFCLCASGSDGEAWGTNVSPGADCSITAVIHALASDGGIDLGVRTIHVSTWISGYYVILQYAAGVMGLTMQKSTLAGFGGNVGTIGGVAVTVTLPCTVKFEAIGSAISVYVNGTLADTGTDTELTAAGRPYFYMTNTTSTHAEIDSIVFDATLPTDFWTDFVKTSEIL